MNSENVTSPLDVSDRHPRHLAGEPLWRRLGIRLPILQAGMGGVAGPQLAAAVCEAGAGGVLGLYKRQGRAIRQWLDEIRRLTSAPFGVNLIPEILDAEGLKQQVDAVLQDASPPLFFTFFGLPPASALRGLESQPYPWIVQVGTPEEASKAQDLGADGVVLQNTQAGGHHLGNAKAKSLLDGAKKAGVTVPLIAAGGIGTGADLTRMLDLGYCGVMVGTLFVPCHESLAHNAYKRHVLNATADRTVITNAFSLGWPGRPHRVLRSRVTDHPDEGTSFIGRKTIGGKTVPIARGSCAVPTLGTTGRIDDMAMYCGTGCGSINRLQSAAEVVDNLSRTWLQTRRRLQPRPFPS